MIPVLGVPVLANVDMLYRMLESIDEKVGTLVIVDNGRGVVDQDRVRDAIADHCDDVYILRMPSNLGVPGSWNLIIKSTPFAPWWLIANFDIVWPTGALARFAAEARTDALVLSGGYPAWCAFAVGEQVVERVGLFDEGIHPAYFEDNDYARRVEYHELPIVSTDIPVAHYNSSTLAAGYGARNTDTFAANADYYGHKVASGDYTEGRWSLRTRRDLSWD